MTALRKSAGGPAAVPAAAASGATRNGEVTLREVVRAYMDAYSGRDTTRPQRLTWWCAQLGNVRLVDLDEDHVHDALRELATRHGRFWAGSDADGATIYKSKAKVLSPASINRYHAALGAVLTWSIHERVAPKGWDNPCKRIKRKEERNHVIRFLSDDERVALLAACRASKWNRLYLLVLMGITTGARRGELDRMRWRDFDFERGTCTITITKNDDPKIVALTPAVVDELRRHERASSALVFASTRRPDQAYTFDPVWDEALRVAKIKKFRFHDLRHTCASYLAMSGASLVEIADVLGHRNLSVTKRYSHLATSHKAALIGKVMKDVK